MQGIEDRPYQTKIIQTSVEAFAKDYTSILVESPTGSGKTIMALRICKAMQRVWTDLRIGWVAMRRKLLLQAAAESKRVGVENIEFVSMFNHQPPEVDFLVIDEAQHDAAASCATIHRRSGAHFFLGLTATPFRTDNMKLAFEKVIKDCGVRFLIEQGYLSPFRQLIIPDWKPQTVAERYLAERERWGKSVVYFHTYEECREFQQLIEMAGVECALILGSTPHAKQDELHERFESGDLKLVVNINLLTEGFDSPDLQTVWVRDASKLPTIQMVGRVLRKSPGKVANVVQSERTLFPYTKVTRMGEEYSWQDDRWLSLQKSDLVEKMAVATREALVHVAVTSFDPVKTGGGRIQVSKKGQLLITKKKQRVRQQDSEGHRWF